VGKQSTEYFEGLYFRGELSDISKRVTNNQSLSVTVGNTNDSEEEHFSTLMINRK
jgi:hypothetical protein